jgi:cysteine synthase A
MVQLRQFENEANVTAHYQTTAEEIIEQTGDRAIDAFVASVGTGGTLTGVGRRLREVYPDVEIVAVEPVENPVLSTGKSGSDDFQGMGPGFVSEILDTELIDVVETVTLEAAETECRRLAMEEGILVGQSSGAANIGANRVADRLADPSMNCPTAPDRTRVLFSDGGTAECPVIVTVFPDSGERYLSAGTFEE